MSHTKEDAFLQTEEVTRGDLQEDDGAEQTTPSQQADADEQVEDTQSQVVVTVTRNFLQESGELDAHESSLKKGRLC